MHAQANGSISPVGFIGLGTMGKPMAVRLLDQGVALVIHDAMKTAAEPLIDRGAVWASSPEDVARHADIVLMSLPGPPQVEAVVSGPNGLLGAFRKAGTVVDLSTNSVAMVRSLAETCRQHGVAFVDCPVTGGAKGSADGTLVLMAGGDQNALEQVRPLLARLSREIVYLGASGAGTAAKLINNQIYLCGEILFYESLTLASKAGLNIDSLLQILNMSGAGGVHSKLAGRVLDRRFDDNTFALTLAEKDVALFIEAGRALDVPVPASAAAHQLFVAAKAAGFGNRNFWSTIEVIEKNANTRVAKSN